jgi:FkbM family methyltransferase
MDGQNVLSLAASLDRPLVYVDVGALWGVDNPMVKQLASNGKLRVVGFEPDEAECARLRQANPADIYLPYGVGDVDGSLPFHITHFNACSSFLEPDMSAWGDSPHAELVRVVRTIDMPTRRLDSLIGEGAIPMPDFMKIDSQGFELNILKGCGEALRQLVGVRLETHLRPIYKGEATFFEIFAFMNNTGFILRDLHLTFPFEFEAVEFEAFFSIDPRGVNGARLEILKIWELMHNIPAGRTIKNGRFAELVA